MAIKVKNIATGEVKEVANTGLMDGKLFVFGKNEPARWAAKYEFFKLTGNILASGAYNKYEIEFVEGIGYELCAAGTKPARTRKPQPKPEPEPTPQPQPEPEPKEEEITGHTEPEPTPQPTPQPQPTFNVGGLEGGLAAVFAPVFNQVAQQIEANVRAKVDAEMSELKRVAEEKARVLKIELPDGREGKVEGLTMEGFDDMVKDLEEGYNIYMYGPAGTGKSHTAKQLAEALGLPYYELNQVEFAHEVCGYGDAAGNYVPTPAYEAAVNGGLLFFDEWDRSAQSATTVVNTMLANRRFTFPVVGNVEVHPNFRVVAAGNTAMTGSDSDYVAANVIDASSRDRFVFYKTDYDERIELPVMARGDKELIEFMQELRKAIKKSHVQMVASMRATKYLKDHESNKKNALRRGLLKGMESEDVRVILSEMYGKIEDNKWYKELNTISMED